MAFLQTQYETLLGGIRHLNSLGIVGIKEAGVGFDHSDVAEDEVPLLERADREGHLTLRCLFSLFMVEDNANTYTSQ